MFDITEKRVTDYINTNDLDLLVPVLDLHPGKEKDEFYTYARTRLPITLEQADDLISYTKDFPQLASIIYNNEQTIHPYYDEPVLCRSMSDPGKLYLLLGEYVVTINFYGEICDVFEVTYEDKDCY